MNSLYENAQRQSGEELLSGNLDPSFYTTVLAEAEGNVEKAAGLYAERRAEVIYEKLQEENLREMRRLELMAWVPLSATKSVKEVDLFRPLMLALSIFLSSTSVLLCLCGFVHKELCLLGLGKVVIAAFVVMIASVIGGVLVRKLYHRISFVSAMVPMACLLAMASLGLATLAVKKNQSVSWNHAGEIETDVPLENLQAMLEE